MTVARGHRRMGWLLLFERTLQSDGMNEGWHGGDYLILFTEAEIALASDRFATSKWLPGYQVLGLRGWDDLILRDSAGHTHLVPTVPLDPRYISSFDLPENVSALKRDERYCGKIKWYVKPIIFGGDPSDEKNLIWVTHEQHGQLVNWWNEQYRSVKQQTNAGQQGGWSRRLTPR
jgi:hypothetical protein